MTTFILLTLLLHLLGIDWGRRHLNAPQNSHSEPTRITVKLQPPAQPIALPAAAPAPPKTPRAHVKTAKPPAPRRPDPLPTTTPTATAPAETPPAEPAAFAAAAQVTTTTDSAAVAALAAETDPRDAGITAGAEGTHYHVDPPPSAQLDYDVQASYNTLSAHGSGTLVWQTDGAQYTVTGLAEDFLFTFLRFTSSGEINAFGVAPELYTEKKIRRAATNTHFNRERNVVSFSASTNTYPRVGGEQDRASLIWQLAGIGRGDRDQFVAGATIDMFVAGIRDGEVWRLQIAGQEDIQVPAGTLQTWHVVRQPRPGSYDQRLDIWLAPEQQWYPVRLRFSETNGDYLEMSLSKLKTL